MPDESEVIQSDVFVDFPLPNGKTLPGKPVPYTAARKIMAAMHAFDQTGDYEQTLVPALEQFSQVSGLSDEQIMAACPDMSLGELTTAIQRFFFRRRPIATNGAAAPSKSSPAAGA
jgi:hypothetical protein